MHRHIVIFALLALFLAKHAIATPLEIFHDTTSTENSPFPQGQGNFTTNNYPDTVTHQGTNKGNR